jgi:mannose-6-phosphate isomerase
VFYTKGAYVKVLNYGGNQVRSVSFDRLVPGQALGLAEGKYQYMAVRLAPGAPYGIDFPYWTAVVVGGNRCSLRTRTESLDARTHDVALGSGPVTFSVEGGSVDLLVAATSAPISESAPRVLGEDQIKKVQKPWGYELWLTGEAPAAFAFKKIFIKSGTKTSLQYHLKKQETNFLFDGSVLLHYKGNSEIANDQVSPDDVASVPLHAKSAIDVEPTTLHRLEATSDVTLYEVSTPEVDDVVRVQDDARRPSGRIATEHVKV